MNLDGDDQDALHELIAMGLTKAQVVTVMRDSMFENFDPTDPSRVRALAVSISILMQEPRDYGASMAEREDNRRWREALIAIGLLLLPVPDQD